MPAASYDIIVIGDFRFPGGTSTAVAEELTVQAAAGYRTALVQLKGPVLKYPHPFHPMIRACIDDGRVDLIDPDRPIAGRLLLAHHPTLFTHRLSRGLQVTAERKLLVVWHPPLDGAGEPSYDWARIHGNASSSLGEDLVWAPVGPLVRAQFGALDEAPPLFDADWYSVVDPAAWEADRTRFCDSRPVIGRHSRPDPLKWPDTRDLVLAAYPDDSRFLVRVLGGGPYLRELVGVYPRNWQVLGFNAMAPERFLETIDFFVYFHHSRWVEAFGRTIIEALASGAVAVLPAHFEALFGDAALYAQPADVPELVRAYRADATAYRRQSVRGRTVVRDRFSHAAHRRRLHELIGPPRPVATAPGWRPAQRRAPLRVLFMSSNGVGMGHLTRLLAIARRCPAPLESIFLTLSQALKVVREQGYLAEYLPFHNYLGCDVSRWNVFLRDELNEVISFYQPRVLVFDGHVPYGGLVEAIKDNPDVWFVWCRRGMWRAHAGADMIKREVHFDAVIEPRDLAQSFDRGLTLQYRARTREVEPIRLLDDDEVLPRDQARAALGLRPSSTVVLLLLGAGNNYDYELVKNVALAKLARHEDVRAVAAQWLMADRPLPLPAHVTRLAEYPIGRYLKAFDFAISAVGYNSFHELLFAAVPTIFVPNENPQQDDQLGRASYAEQHGLGLCVRTRDLYRLVASIERLLSPEERERISGRCAALPSANGAIEGARLIEEMAYGQRADRP